MDIVAHCKVCGDGILERSWAQRRHNLCHKHLCLERTKMRYHSDPEYRRDRQKYGRDYYRKKEALKKKKKK